MRHWTFRLALLGVLVLVTAGCDWPMFRYGPAGTGFNTTESEVGVANVGSLVQKWFGWTDTPYYNLGAVSSPVVANGVVYVGQDVLNAFDAAGVTNCGPPPPGPTLCSPLWTAPVGVRGSPAVANGVVYVNSDKLNAFDVAGGSPLWTAMTGNTTPSWSSPVVANGIVYVSSVDGMLYAFDAAGVTGCSGTPKTCNPLWTATFGGDGFSSPAVANGVVYVGAKGGKLYAFNATGTTGCSGVPKTCAPLWTTKASGTNALSSPVIANGIVYVSSADNLLYAFDAAGTRRCSGIPKTCNPLWTAAIGSHGSSFSPAVAKGVVYVTSSLDGRMYAFDAAGTTGCSGTPKTCNPLWTSTAPSPNYDYLETLAVANGVVYTGSHYGILYAFDAAGTTGCSGTPKTCSPLGTVSAGTYPAIDASSPTVANGVVYYNGGGIALHAFGLP